MKHIAMIQRNIFLGFGPQTELSEVPFFTNWSFIVDRMPFFALYNGNCPRHEKDTQLNKIYVP